MRRARTERPENFEVDLSHPLMRGAVLLGLGQAHHSIRYRDESQYGNHGVLTGYTGAGDTPADRWVWIDTLGRRGLGFDGSDDYVLSPCPLVLSTTSPLSASWWSKAASVNSLRAFLAIQTATGNAYQLISVWYASGFRGLFCGRFGTSNLSAKPSVAITQTDWHHFCLTCIGGSSALVLYVDGKLNSAVANANVGVGNPGIYLGYAYSSYYTALTMADVIVHSRVLSAAEIMRLADPSNVMMSGAIREPRPRRNFVGQVGAAAKPWLYAHRRSSRVIGVGI